VAVRVAFAVFVSVPLKLLTFVAPVKPFKFDVPVGALQVYVVLAGIVPVNAAVKAAPLQVVMLTLLIAAVGNTETVAVKPGPLQPLDVGVMK
jgi:hypothetical protein